MYKVSVIGHFGQGINCSDGQTVKTKTVTEALEAHYGAQRLCRVDTHGGLKTLLKAPATVKKAFSASENVIILPAQNGLRVFAPLCALWKRKRPAVKLHYIVIGGWLPGFVKKHSSLLGSLKAFDAIYVETSAMKKALAAMGFENLILMPNCKDLAPLNPEQLVYSTQEPLKLCTFSRVMKEKGIEEAVRAVERINRQQGREVYRLDIYGGVDAGQTDWFESLKESFPTSVRYMGVVPYDRSVAVIKEYFALLFPTRFFTEGIPGTILDAFAAGVPVISAKWENYGDILEDGVTAMGYDFEDVQGLENTLDLAAQQPERMAAMKANCLAQLDKYLPGAVIQKVINMMEE